MIALLLTSCSFSLQVPEGRLTQIGQESLSVAHPFATFQQARLVGASAGGCGTGSGDRFVDLAVDYTGGLASKQETMTVRFMLMNVDPCTITTDVLSDSGPMPPVLLDNWVASDVMGGIVCETLGAKPPPE